MTSINDRIKAARYGRCIIEWTTTETSQGVAIEYNHSEPQFWLISQPMEIAG